MKRRWLALMLTIIVAGVACADEKQRIDSTAPTTGRSGPFLREQRLHIRKVQLVRARGDLQVLVQQGQIEQIEQEQVIAEARIALRQAELKRAEYLKGRFAIDEKQLLNQIELTRNRWKQAAEKARASERLANQGLLNQKELAVDQVAAQRILQELENEKRSLTVLKNSIYQRKKILLDGAVQLAEQIVSEGVGAEQARFRKQRNAIDLQQQLIETLRQGIAESQKQQEVGATIVDKKTQRRGSGSIDMRTPQGGALVVKKLVKQGTRVARGDTLATFVPEGLSEQVALQKLVWQQAVKTATEVTTAGDLQKRIDERQQIAAKIAAQTVRLELSEFVDGTHASQLQELETQLKTATEEKQRAVQQLNWSRRVAKKGYVTMAEVQKDEFTLFDCSSRCELLQKELVLLEGQQLRDQQEILQSRCDEAVRQVERVRNMTVAREEQARAQSQAAEMVGDLEEAFFKELSSHKERYSVQAPFNGRVNYLPVADQQGTTRSRLQPGRTVSGNTRFAVLEAD